MLNTKFNLPKPDISAFAHSEKLFQFIANEIQNNEGISFARYMELALYAPGLGYYSSGTHKLGAAGDFVTAAEISPLFSYCLAKQCQQIINAISGASILELGAGSGIMAADLLFELEQRDSLPEYYYILEVSADLKERQRKLLQQKIPHLMDRIIWLDQLPKKIKGIILGNEILDALPVHKFKIQNGIKEFFVSLNKGKFIWQLRPAESNLKHAVEKLKLAENYESEINLLLLPWLQSLERILQQGMILFIDYGFPRHEYYHGDRLQGTLMCHYRHYAHDDPFFLPGLQDITAHVDFTTVANAAEKIALSLAGYTTQAHFLLSCKIEEYIANVLDVKEHFILTQQIKQLILPSEMGELFKAIAFTKNFNESLMGFQLYNMREKLNEKIIHCY